MLSNLDLKPYLLHILHSVLAFITSIGSYWTSLASKFQFHNVTNGQEWMPAGYYTIPVADEIQFAGLKTPLHLGLLVLEDTYCLATIALVISLAYSIGTRHVSVYAKGMNELEYLELEKKISCLLSLNPKYKSALVDVRHILHPAKRIPGAPDQLNVGIVHPSDGKKMLTDVTKHMSRLLRAGTISQADITTEYIDKLLQDRLGSPDPDLVLKFGSVPSLCGYLPWQMRLAEIISFPTLKGFAHQRMKKALMIFSKLEQRFGK